MKKIFLLAAFSTVICFAEAQQLKTPAASPSQTVKQEFGLSAVELSYSRPAVKGRTIFGDLVPYGKVWRTGANAATTISFGDDVTFGGKKIPAGKYGLLTIPNASEWTVILTKQLNVTSPSAYKEDQDVARVKVNAVDLPFPLESFLISFDNILPSSMNMIIGWDRTVIIIPITTDVNTKINAQISSLEGKENFPYFAAAAYYLENGKDLNKALGWFNKATEKEPDAFWIWHQKAKCLAKLGKKKEAVAAANKSTALAATAKNEDYVTLNKKLLATLN
ncbi:DUF2911 domain-containing protein [Agriterribacter sp.]|uniref:DUF2911 domain-containing protein n=1 Tax=Agriterribacter sp. TaxID=2821509 RepID=UPI002C01D485|nr:DUF2911 domain-containing protein [Agriterribacter sp.]HRO48354.1 DUF2911 domain-containing protein [Agriterribacter sp.]